ncbi:hypothetical protein [Micromonospora sp. 067-2]|uniref:hypothetical protein n=1 Tax=Micromonospora sp. 067-2 TaxID=2789270 RepID=UPI00397BEEF3
MSDAPAAVEATWTKRVGAASAGTTARRAVTDGCRQPVDAGCAAQRPQEPA